MRRRALAARRRTAAPGLRRASSVDSRVLSSPSDDIVWDGGQKAIAEEGLVVGTAVLQAHRRRVPAEPAPAGRAHRASADSYFEEGGTANYVLAVSSYHEFLTLYPQHPRADYAQFRAGESLLQAEEQPRPRPDAPPSKRSRSTRSCSTCTPSRPTWSRPARASGSAVRRSPARTTSSASSTSERRQAWRSAIGRYETILNDYPDYDKTDEVLYRSPSASRPRDATRRPCRSSAGWRRSIPTSQFLARGDEAASDLPRRPTPAAPPAAEPPAPQPAPARTGRRRPAARRPRRRSDLKCHFEESSKSLLT